MRRNCAALLLAAGLAFPALAETPMLIPSPDAVVLYVRESYEFEAAHSQGALLFPMGELS